MTLLSGNPHPEDSTFCLLWLVVQKPKPWGNCAAKTISLIQRQNNFIEESIFGKNKKERGNDLLLLILWSFS
jgi:hypothetical protein